MITGLFRDLITRHFSGPNNIETADLKHILWQPGDETGILVESIHRWRSTTVEKRPAVILKRNSYKNLKVGIGNSLGVNGRGQRQFATYWVGSHTLFCLHGSGAAAEILATEVQHEITRFAPVLRHELHLIDLAVVEVAAIGEIEEAREGFVVPVTAGWAYEEAWTLEQEAPKLQHLPMSLLLDWCQFSFGIPSV